MSCPFFAPPPIDRNEEKSEWYILHFCGLILLLYYIAMVKISEASIVLTYNTYTNE